MQDPPQALPPIPWPAPRVSGVTVDEPAKVVVQGETNEEGEIPRPEIFLTSADDRHPRGYQLVEREPFYKSEGKRVYRGYALEFLGVVRNEELGKYDNLFLRPIEKDIKYAAIKRIALKKRNAITGKMQDITWGVGGDNPYDEIAAMQSLNPDCDVDQDAITIGCMDALQDEKHLYIVTPFLPRRSLLHFTRLFFGEERNQVRVFFRKLVVKVQALHDRGVVHFDLKNGNVGILGEEVRNNEPRTVVDKDPILIDLGTAKQVDRDAPLMLLSAEFGTLAFQAPEISRGDAAIDPYAVDVWSLGATLYTLLTGYLLYSKPFDQRYMYFIERRRLLHDGYLNNLGDPGDPVRTLLMGMLNPDPAQRMRLHQVQAHQW